MKAPAPTLWFFAAALIFIAYGVFETRDTATDRGRDEPIAEQADVTSPALASATGAPNFAWTFNALDPGREVSGDTSAVAFDPMDTNWGLPPGDGQELVAAWCAACHSMRIVMQQRASKERWDALLIWMVEKQGMAEMPPEDREAVLSYLSENFS